MMAPPIPVPRVITSTSSAPRAAPRSCSPHPAAVASLPTQTCQPGQGLGQGLGDGGADQSVQVGSEPHRAGAVHQARNAHPDRARAGRAGQPAGRGGHLLNQAGPVDGTGLDRVGDHPAVRVEPDGQQLGAADVDADDGERRRLRCGHLSGHPGP